MKEEFKSTSIAEMKMRDWFATQAMMGMLANSSIGGVPDVDYVTRAYYIADLMLKARSE